jgi:serine/threonine-protein kinase
MRLEDLQGQRLGRYELVSVLGRGGMAAVYRAHDTLLHRDVAIKILYPQYSTDGSLIERFKREAVMAAQLDHPNIVPIYDVGEAAGLVYIAMKLLNGRSLADLLHARQAVPLQDLIPLVEQIAAALDYAHARGIVHRDIKAGNILIEGPARTAGSPLTLSAATASRAILTDFGIAKSLDAPGMTGTGVLLGTPDYMAPEQIRGDVVDGRADLYALGVLVYRCLTGRRLFEGGTEEVLLGHLHGRIADPSSVEPSLPPALDPVIRRALARRPDERYRTASEFAHALRAAAGMELPTPPPARRRDQDGRVVVPRLAADDMVRRDNLAGATTRKGAVVAPGARVLPVAPPFQRARPSGSAAGGVMLAVLLLFVIGGGGLLLARALQERDPGAAGAIVTTPRPTETALPAQTTASAATPAPVAVPPTSFPTASPPTETAAPTHTPAPAATPKPTTTPTPGVTTTPTATPTATSTAIVCSAGLVGGFGQLWHNSQALQQQLGCPQTAEQGGQIAEQPFEGGSMFWFGPLDTIYVLIGHDGGSWRSFGPGDLKNRSTPTPVEAPPGLVAPVSGFGLVWGTEPDVKAKLGWGTKPEAGPYNGAYQPFEQGFMLFSPTGLDRGKTIYVLYQDGTFERYDDPNR